MRSFVHRFVCPGLCEVAGASWIGTVVCGFGLGCHCIYWLVVDLTSLHHLDGSCVNEPSLNARNRLTSVGELTKEQSGKSSVDGQLQ